MPGRPGLEGSSPLLRMTKIPSSRLVLRLRDIPEKPGFPGVRGSFVMPRPSCGAEAEHGCGPDHHNQRHSCQDEQVGDDDIPLVSNYHQASHRLYRMAHRVESLGRLNPLGKQCCGIMAEERNIAGSVIKLIKAMRGSGCVSEWPGRWRGRRTQAPEAPR